jgi:hypothetical protein
MAHMCYESSCDIKLHSISSTLAFTTVLRPQHDMVTLHDPKHEEYMALATCNKYIFISSLTYSDS